MLALGEEGGGGWGDQGPGDRAPPQLAALSIVAGLRQPCLHPNNAPSVQRARPGTHYLVYPHPAVLARGLPTTPRLQGDTPWNLGTKGQGFLQPILPIDPQLFCPPRVYHPEFPWIPVKGMRWNSEPP